MPPRNTTHFKKVDVKAKAKVIAESFTIESFYELPLPLVEVKINGLYVLLLETDNVMDKKILEKPEETMALLMTMETKVSLGNMLVFTFDQWYPHPPISIIRFAIFCFLWFLLLHNVFLPFSFSMQVGGGIERTSHISDIVKQSLNAWTSRGGGDNTMNKFNQMKCL
jgi:hypothetical protein